MSEFLPRKLRYIYISKCGIQARGAYHNYTKDVMFACVMGLNSHIYQLTFISRVLV